MPPTWAVLMDATNMPKAVLINVEYCNSSALFFSLPVLLLIKGKLWSEIFDEDHLLENANALASLAIHTVLHSDPQHRHQGIFLS